MVTPDILESVGFEKSKIGSGDKELGYVIKRSRAKGLAFGSLALVGILTLGVVLTMFEVRFDRRSFHRQLRKEEHHAASKLAQVEMELWSQYREDIIESNEAHALLRSLNASYGQLQVRIQETIDVAAKELNLNKDKATHLADKILAEVADMQTDNVKHAKHLVDHLVTSGKKGSQLEKYVGREVVHEMQEEERLEKEDADEGLPPAFEDHAGGDNASDPLSAMLDGFWATFDDYESEFKGKPRETLKEGNPVFEALKELKKKIDSSEPPGEEDIGLALDKIDLTSIGAGLGSGRVLPAADIVEELLLIPKIPHKELTVLEEAWRKGEKNSVDVFTKLVEWHSQGLVPAGWLQMGVNKDELEEEKMEEKEEEEMLKEAKAIEGQLLKKAEGAEEPAKAGHLRKAS